MSFAKLIKATQSLATSTCQTEQLFPLSKHQFNGVKLVLLPPYFEYFISKLNQQLLYVAFDD